MKEIPSYLVMYYQDYPHKKTTCYLIITENKQLFHYKYKFKTLFYSTNTRLCDAMCLLSLI